MSIKRQPIVLVSIEYWEDQNIEVPDTTFEPEAVLRAKSELLADFLGCDVDSAERLILGRITSLD